MHLAVDYYNEQYHIEYNNEIIICNSDDNFQKQLINLAQGVDTIYIRYTLSDKLINFFKYNWNTVNNPFLRNCIHQGIRVSISPILLDGSIWVSISYKNLDRSAALKYYYRSEPSNYFIKRILCSSVIVDKLCVLFVEEIIRRTKSTNNVTVQTEHLAKLFQERGFNVKVNSINRELYVPTDSYFKKQRMLLRNSVKEGKADYALQFVEHGLYNRLSCQEYEQLLNGEIPNCIREV